MNNRLEGGDRFVTYSRRLRFFLDPPQLVGSLVLHLVGGDENLCLHIHTMLWCFSSPGIATPSDGALRWHPRTLTALRTQSGVEDAGGERGIVCVARMWGVRPLGGAINIDQWERGGQRSKVVSLPGENDCLISSMNEIYA